MELFTPDAFNFRQHTRCIFLHLVIETTKPYFDNQILNLKNHFNYKNHFEIQVETMKINYFGAYDRHNYGDILFAQIHTRALKKLGFYSIEARYLSVRKTDECISYGGFSTDTIESLNIEKNSGDDRIVVLGGDVLAADWVGMLGNNSNPTFYFFLKVLKKIIGFYAVNRFLKYAYNKNSIFPYVLSNTKNVYYTGVSGSRYDSRKHNAEVIDALSHAVSVSVRDQETYENLARDNRINLKLSPDTALIMSDLYTEDELNSSEYLQSMVRNVNFNEKNYIAFQIGSHYSAYKIKEIANEIDDYIKHSSKSILFVPIGRATGHLDHLALKKIYKILNKKDLPVAILTSPHVNSIMAAIAFSSGYVGTSLHGAITAYTFQRKVCCLFPDRVIKLSSYFKTWVDQKDFSLSDIQGLSLKMSEIFSGGDFYSVTRLKDQKNMVYIDIKNYLKN